VPTTSAPITSPRSEIGTPIPARVPGGAIRDPVSSGPWFSTATASPVEITRPLRPSVIGARRRARSVMPTAEWKATATIQPGSAWSTKRSAPLSPPISLMAPSSTDWYTSFGAACSETSACTRETALMNCA
jgi:hypothetical protein